ncbi:MAG: hypothetical protein E4H01_08100 [Lysobacterales bacterium]|nr:MAG: hypothetical protein E4H01_08100 [Xanthomonadales bacterium]
MQPDLFETVRSETLANGARLELQYRKPGSFNGRDWSHGWIVVVPGHYGGVRQGQYGPLVTRPDEALRLFFGAYDELNAYAGGELFAVRGRFGQQS